MTLLKSSKAFISLPILLILLFLISLSYQFNQQQADQRQWRYQTQQAVGATLIWQAFEFQVISNLDVNLAKTSSCGTLCVLDMSQSVTDNWSNQYRYDNEVLYWVFEKEDALNGYFRLCAKRVLMQSVRCWWLKEKGGQLYWFANLPITY